MKHQKCYSPGSLDSHSNLERIIGDLVGKTRYVELILMDCRAAQLKSSLNAIHIVNGNAM